jgi:hypothetical protein
MGSRYLGSSLATRIVQASILTDDIGKFGGKIFWNCVLQQCGARGRNRTDTTFVGGFSYHFGFRRQENLFVVWSTPSPSHELWSMP